MYRAVFLIDDAEVAEGVGQTQLAAEHDAFSNASQMDRDLAGAIGGRFESHD